MNETIVRSAFGVVLTRIERPGLAGTVATEYRLSLPSGGQAQVFANFADADAAWLCSLGGEPAGKSASMAEALPVAKPIADWEAHSSPQAADR